MFQCNRATVLTLSTHLPNMLHGSRFLKQVHAVQIGWFTCKINGKMADVTFMQINETSESPDNVV